MLNKKKPINGENSLLKQKEERLKNNLALAQETLTRIENNDRSVLNTNKNKPIIKSIKQPLTQRSNNHNDIQPLATKRNGINHQSKQQSIDNINTNTITIINSNANSLNKKDIKGPIGYKKAKCSSLVNVNNYLTERTTRNPNSSLEKRIEESLQRITEQNRLREEKKELLKAKYIAEENNKMLKTTKKVSFREAEKIKESFIERLKKTEEESKEKKKQIELERKKKEEILLLRAQTKKKKKQEVILKQINEMFEWNQKRKDKIRIIRSQENLKQDKLMKDCFQPKICEKSKKIAQKQLNKSTENAFDRLYHDDEKRKEKRELLQSLYKPTFSPVLNKKRALNTGTSRTITINDYCDMTIHCDVEELLRNKVYQNRKNKTIEVEHTALPVLTEISPFLNNSHLSDEHSKEEEKPQNSNSNTSSSKKSLQCNNNSNENGNSNLSNTKNNSNTNEGMKTISVEGNGNDGKEVLNRIHIEKQEQMVNPSSNANGVVSKADNILNEKNGVEKPALSHSSSRKSKDSRKSISRSSHSSSDKRSQSNSGSGSYTSRSYSSDRSRSNSNSKSDSRSRSSDRSNRSHTSEHSRKSSNASNQSSKRSNNLQSPPSKSNQSHSSKSRKSSGSKA